MSGAPRRVIDQLDSEGEADPEACESFAASGRLWNSYGDGFAVVGVRRSDRRALPWRSLSLAGPGLEIR